MMKRNLSFLVALFFVASTSVAAPHELGQSYLFLSIYDETVEGRFEIALQDLNEVLGLGYIDMSAVTREQLTVNEDRILEYVRDRASVTVDGALADMEFLSFDFRDIEVARYVLLTFRIDVERVPRLLDIRYEVLFDQSPEQRGLLVVEHNFRTGTFNNGEEVSLIFSPSRPAQRLDLSTASMWTGFAHFVRLGLWHIWIGIDHILFLIALALPSVLRRNGFGWEPVESFRPAFIYIIKIVTLFTIAHSITLALAALEIVNLPSRLVETIIAASIVVAAADIVYPIFKKNIWIIVFIFGLFHGFGFASNLTRIGLEGSTMALSLLGFNLGVEIGQVGIMCVVFPVLYVIRSTFVYRKLILKPGAIAMMAIAMLWFLERAFEFNVPLKRIASQVMGLLS